MERLCNAAFTGCGHMTCLVCARKLRNRNMPCPACRKKSRFIPIYMGAGE